MARFPPSLKFHYHIISINLYYYQLNSNHPTTTHLSNTSTKNSKHNNNQFNAVSSLCKSWERTEDKQPESAAAGGATIPLIGGCDAV